MSNLLAVPHTNNILIARGSVKHISGGPVMALVGFIHPVANNLFRDIGENLAANQAAHLAEKIILDKKRGIGFYPSVSSEVFYGHIFNQDGKLNGWYNPDTYASKFNCLVRFYDESEKKFVYKVFSPLELELAE